MKIISLILILGISFLSGCSMKSEKYSKNSTQKEEKKIYLKGLVALQNKDAKTAVQMFEDVIKLNPNNEIAHLLAAKIYIESRRPKDAIRILAPAVDQFPNNGEITTLLAIAFRKAGFPKQAFVAAKRSVEIYDAWQKKDELKKAQALEATLFREIQVSEKAAQ